MPSGCDAMRDRERQDALNEVPSWFLVDCFLRYSLPSIQRCQETNRDPLHYVFNALYTSGPTISFWVFYSNLCSVNEAESIICWLFRGWEKSLNNRIFVRDFRYFGTGNFLCAFWFKRIWITDCFTMPPTRCHFLDSWFLLNISWYLSSIQCC